MVFTFIEVGDIGCLHQWILLSGLYLKRISPSCWTERKGGWMRVKLGRSFRRLFKKKSGSSNQFGAIEVRSSCQIEDRSYKVSWWIKSNVWKRGINMTLKFLARTLQITKLLFTEMRKTEGRVDLGVGGGSGGRTRIRRDSVLNM